MRIILLYGPTNANCAWMNLPIAFVNLFSDTPPSSFSLAPNRYPSPLRYQPSSPSPWTLPSLLHLFFRLHPFLYHYFIPSSVCRDIFLHISLPFTIYTYSIFTQLPTYLSTSNRTPLPPPTNSHFSYTMRRSGRFQASRFTTLRLISERVAALARGGGLIGSLRHFREYVSFSFFLSLSLFTFSMHLKK